MGDVYVELMWLTFGASLLLIPIVFMGNRFTYLLVFRRGWSWHIDTPIERQRGLAAEWPPPEPPVELPTRGGSLRRPL